MTQAIGLADETVALDPQGDWKEFEAALKGLCAEMSKPIPDRTKITGHVNATLKPLERRLGRSRVARSRPPRSNG